MHKVFSMILLKNTAQEDGARLGEARRSVDGSLFTEEYG